MPDLEHPEPDNCVGPSSEQAGKASACEGCPNQKACADGAGREEDPAVAQVAAQLERVKRKVLVLSGKGGVGKSTVASQLAFGLAARGLRVGLLDIDICGPSAPLMLGVTGQSVHSSASGWSPVWVDVPQVKGASPPGPDDEDGELGVMSIGFLLPGSDDAVIWRGPRKNGLIKQFLTDVEWGGLDVLLVDTPPGTSDEHISAVQYLKRALGPRDGAVVVTTPQEASMADVRKELNFCRKTSLQVLGVVENMSGLALPLATARAVDAAGRDVSARLREALLAADPDLLRVCSIVADVFPTGSASARHNARGLDGPEGMAAEFGVPFLGKLPLDPAVGRAGDTGTMLDAVTSGGGAGGAVGALCDSLVRDLFPDGDSGYKFSAATPGVGAGSADAKGINGECGNVADRDTAGAPPAPGDSADAKMQDSF
mmetsp:Transcript_17176/g.42242  ORF Transcript_17176/g.42242 Transcript_17176/m.42242 type:complete len:428 (+) Transcript_17176:36-1319(+)